MKKHTPSFDLAAWKRDRSRKGKASLEGLKHLGCGGRFRYKRGPIPIHERGTVDDVMYNVCNKCGQEAVTIYEFNRVRREHK